jgi:outer membrane protein TolC
MLAWILLLSVPGQIAASPPGGPIDFAQALALARESPALLASEAAVARRAELTDQVPWLTFNPAVIAQPGVRRTAQGTIGPEGYLGLMQELSLAGAGSSRQRAARAELDAERLDHLALHRAIALNAAQAWFALWAAQTALAAANEELTLARDWDAKVARGAASGGFTRVDVAVANAYRAEAELAALSLQGEVFVRGVALNRALGLDASRPAVAASTLPAFDEPAEAAQDEQVLAQAPNAPGARAAAAHLAAEKARGVELEAGKGSSLQVGALGWREGTGDLAAVATLQLSVPLFERAQRERSVNAATTSRAEGRAAAALIDERAERLDALHEVEHSAEVQRAIEQSLVPATRTALEGLERRFDAGEATAQDLVVARRALVSAKARLVRARADVAWARFRLATLVQEVVR